MNNMTFNDMVCGIRKSNNGLAKKYSMFMSDYLDEDADNMHEAHRFGLEHESRERAQWNREYESKRSDVSSMFRELADYAYIRYGLSGIIRNEGNGQAGMMLENDDGVEIHIDKGYGLEIMIQGNYLDGYDPNHKFAHYKATSLQDAENGIDTVMRELGAGFY